MAVHEQLACEEWLYGALVADSALGSVVSTRIYSHVAPPKVAYPFVLISPISARDENHVAGYRGCVEVMYQVAVHGQGASMGPLRAAANRIDAVLHAQHGTVTASGTVTIACTRDEPICMAAVTDGVRYNVVGGAYRLFAGAADIEGGSA